VHVRTSERSNFTSGHGCQYTPGDSIATVSIAAFAEPVGQTAELAGEAPELTHRLVVAIMRHGHEVRGAADVDAGRVGVSQGQRRGPAAAAVLCLRCVMACSIIELWNVTPRWGTSS
jgi:hypothetical protein